MTHQVRQPLDPTDRERTADEAEPRPWGYYVAAAVCVALIPVAFLTWTAVGSDHGLVRAGLAFLIAALASGAIYALGAASTGADPDEPRP